jgi:hypothetical protein
MSPNQFSVIPKGTAWPSGNYHELALLPVSDSQIELAVGTQLLHGVEEGLGAWAAIALRLSCGAVVELINYRQSPRPGFVLRAEVGFEPGAVLREVLALLGMASTAASWVSPMARG